MKRKNVAVFNTQPPHLYFGGVERRIIEVARRLSNKADTKVYCGTKKGFKKISFVNRTVLIPCFSTDVFFPLDNWIFNKTISRMFDTIKADVYEAHTVSGYGFLKAIQKRRIIKPFIQTIHGVLADEYMQSSRGASPTLRAKLSNRIMWQLAKIEECSAKNATLIVTVSEYSSKKIVQFYKINKTKIRMVPNGVDPQRFRPVEDLEKVKHRIGINGKRCILFVGRLIPRKGLLFLIEAARQVVKENKETMFVIVGDGPLKNHLTSFLKREKLADNFVFLGDVSDDMLILLYNCCDIFTLPSIQEGQGIALLEAQATAKPVVAFNVGGISEFVLNRQTGLLVKPDSIELANAILNLLSNKSLREKMGHLGREFVCDNFSWDICAKKMLQVYNEALTQAKPTQSNWTPA
jgi:glycosyltransferase involved in cell wall biosynthesis